MIRNESPLEESHRKLPWFIDSHCHLDDESFSTDLDDVLDRSRAVGVTRWINVGYTPERWQSSLDLVEKYSGMACMLGVHPGHANSWSDRVHRDLGDVVRRHRPVAVGEIGLDFYRGETNTEIQVLAFAAQLELACEAGIPAVIHMRNAEPMVLEVLSSQSRLPRLLFHSYEGSPELTAWIIEHDAYVGMGGLATRAKSSGVRRELGRLPLNRIVLETDSPYLVPNGFKHRLNTPESIPRIAQIAAELFGTDVATVASETTANCERLFPLLPAATQSVRIT